MHQPRIIRLQVFPGPVQAGQFAECPIPAADVLTRIVSLKTDIRFFPLFLHVKEDKHHQLESSMVYVLRQ